MSLNPAHRFDAARRQKIQNEQVRQLRKRPHGHAEAKTFVVSADITAGMYIPPFFVAVDPDNSIPEVKLLFEFRGLLSGGTADVHWTRNGSTITGSDMTVSTSVPGSITALTLPGVVLAHGDYLQPIVDSATAAANMALAAFIVTRQV